jgi:hypothetical protein
MVAGRRPASITIEGNTMGREERGYSLADLMSGRQPLPRGVNMENAVRVLDEMGGLDAVDWEDLRRKEAAILARQDQSHAAAKDALRALHAPDGISEAGMVEYLISKGGLPGEADMQLALTIRILRELGGRLPRRRKRRRPPRGTP